MESRQPVAWSRVSAGFNLVVSDSATDGGSVFARPAALARLSARRRVAALYAMPAIAGGFMGNMIGFYFMKYSTDVSISAVFSDTRIGLE